MTISLNLPAVDPVMVPLAHIPTDVGAQTRVKVNAAVVRDYAAAMTQQLAEGGLRFPPVILFTDGRENWVGDGLHRILAARKAGLKEIAADVRAGTQRDALLFGICANSAHGLPRTRPDKRKAVALLLADPEWSQWNDREIARRCQVDTKVVSRVRRKSSVAKPQIERRKVRRGGTVYDMKVPARPAPDAASAIETLPAPAGVAQTTDAVGIAVPEHLAKMFAALGDFQEAKDLFERLAGLLDRIAQGPAGELYRQELVRAAAKEPAGFACPLLRMSLQKLLAAEPYCCCCPNCQKAHGARAYPTCPVCRGRGWTTRPAFERCQLSDRQRILRGENGTS